MRLVSWAGLALWGSLLPATVAAERWPHWEAYVRHFVSADGRVIDRTDGDRSTSEGQAYGLFFALVAGDRGTFERLLRWTENNLAAGDLAARLPAWKWGRAEDGGWRVLDENPASDADLWLAYALIEAGRLWAATDHDALGRRVAAQVVAREVAVVPGLGAMLLPAPHGFVDEAAGRWRLNPSYLPLQILRRLRSAGVPGPWDEIAGNTVQMVERVAEKRLAPDWVAFERGLGFVVDPVTGPRGSYDAVRTYLWAGMLPPGEPHGATLRRSLGGLYAHFERHRRVPEQVDTRAGAAGPNEGPVGFAGCLLPEALARGDGAGAAALRQRIDAARRSDHLYGEPPAYYDQNLLLFGLGFAEGRFRFATDGTLKPRWRER